MGNAFTSLIQGLSAHLRMELEITGEDRVHINCDGLALLMEHLPEAEQILLAVPVAEAPPTGREEFYRRLLAGQYLFAETRGATLALDGEARFVCLQIAPYLNSLTRENFPLLVENFLNVAEAWRQRLEGGPAAESRQAPAPASLATLMAGLSKA